MHRLEHEQHWREIGKEPEDIVVETHVPDSKVEDHERECRHICPEDKRFRQAVVSSPLHRRARGCRLTEIGVSKVLAAKSECLRQEACPLKAFALASALLDESGSGVR